MLLIVITKMSWTISLTW